MQTQKQIVTVLEDNEFFNRLLVGRLDEYARRFTWDGEIELQGYCHAGDFLRNLHESTLVAFVDYYLGSSVPTDEVIRIIREKTPHCTIIVVSRTESDLVVQRAFDAGANGFIPKGPMVFDQVCLAMEQALRQKWANTGM